MGEVALNNLYGKTDPLGALLSFWRNFVVRKEVTGDLVDLACGDNRLVHAYGRGVGVDVTNFQGADIVAPDFTKLPLPDANTDTVTIVASLNYFLEPVKVLMEAKRILRPNGRLLLTMSNLRVMKIWHKLRDRRVGIPGLSDDAVLRMLEEAGFKLSKKVSFMLGINVLYVARPK